MLTRAWAPREWRQVKGEIVPKIKEAVSRSLPPSIISHYAASKVFNPISDMNLEFKRPSSEQTRESRLCCLPHFLISIMDFFREINHSCLSAAVNAMPKASTWEGGDISRGIQSPSIKSTNILCRSYARLDGHRMNPSRNGLLDIFSAANFFRCPKHPFRFIFKFQVPYFNR